MSAYSNHFVASIIHNNKPLREFNDKGQRTCKLPFNSEYKIRLQNKNHYRAKVHIEIDGMDAITLDRKIILGAFETLDLERFVDDLADGKKFKFVHKDSPEIQNPGSSDLGKIKISFYRESDYSIFTSSIPFFGGVWSGGTQQQVFGGYRGQSGAIDPLGHVTYGTNNFNTTHTTANNISTTTNASFTSSIGGTAEGSKSEQSFQAGSDFMTSSAPTVIEIWLRGGEIEVEKPAPKVTPGVIVEKKGNKLEVCVNGVRVPCEASINSDGLTLKIKNYSFNA